MKIRSGAVTAAVALALAVSTATPATAAPATVERTDGSFASARFVTTDRIACADGSAGQRRIESAYDGDAWVTSGGRGDGAWSVETDVSAVEIVVHDSCTGEAFTVSGSILYRGGLPLFPRSAKSVDVHASGLDVSSPLPTEWYPQGSADLHFTASSRPTRSTERTREISADGKTFTRNRTTVRSATVSGSIVVSGTGVDYLDDRNLIAGASLVDASFGTSTYKVRTRTHR